jgi:hypothetical protein
MIARRRPHTGSILIGVLAALLVVTGIVASMVKSALQARQAVQQQRLVVQTEFLLEAGIQRAVAKLAANPEYAGETWRLDAEILSGFDAAIVKINVSPPDGETASSVETIAQFPADSPRSVRRSFTFTVSNEE